MNLICIYLPKPFSIDNVSNSLGLKFERTIEKTYHAKLEQQSIFFTQFNVIGFINFSEKEIGHYLHLLGLPNNFQNLVYESYPVNIDGALETHYQINNNNITLKEFENTSLTIIAHVVSQSVALEVFEFEIEKLFKKIHTLLIEKPYSIWNRNKLSTLSQEVVLFRHNIVMDLYLLDKPNVLWENEGVEKLYNSLEIALELKERFDVLEYKLNSLKDDIETISGVLNHKHSSFLEWIIIILIVIEVIMGFYEMFF